jgi:anaerobic ribonucleoside-triphosphate reductase
MNPVRKLEPTQPDWHMMPQGSFSHKLCEETGFSVTLTFTPAREGLTAYFAFTYPFSYKDSLDKTSRIIERLRESGNLTSLKTIQKNPSKA